MQPDAKPSSLLLFICGVTRADDGALSMSKVFYKEGDGPATILSLMDGSDVRRLESFGV
jgi:hypothetical protein